MLEDSKKELIDLEEAVYELYERVCGSSDENVYNNPFTAIDKIHEHLENQKENEHV